MARLSDFGFTSTRGLSKTETGTASAIDALLPLTHGLGSVPNSLELWVEVGAPGSGNWEQHDPSTYFLSTSTQLISTGTTLASVLGGTTNVRLVASSGAVALSVEEASLTKAGIVSTGAQSFAGAKTFASDPTFTSGSQLVTSGAQSFDGAKTFNDSVGIGAASIASKLHVQDNSAFGSGNGFQAHFRAVRSDADSNRSFLFSDSPLGTNAGILSIQGYTQTIADGNERDIALQPNGGNVGIGTSNPLGEFHLQSSNPDFIMYDEAGTANRRLFRIANGSGFLTFGVRNDTNTGSSTGGAATDVILRLDASNGNVGIGAASPNALLDLYVAGAVGTDGPVIRLGTQNSEGSMTGAVAYTEGVASNPHSIAMASYYDGVANEYVITGEANSGTSLTASIETAPKNFIVTRAGAVTLGPSGFDNFHSIIGGINFGTAINEANISVATTNGQIGVGSTTYGTFIKGRATTGVNAISFLYGNGSSVLTYGTVSETGAWTLGPSSPANGVSHLLQGRNDTADSGAVTVFNTGTVGNTFGLRVVKGNTSESTGNYFIGFFAGSSGCGGIQASGVNTAAFFTFSDERLKKDIVPVENALSNILKLKPIEFAFKGREQRQIQISAQSMKATYPQYVSSSKYTDEAAIAEGVDPALDYLQIVGWDAADAILVKAIQELNAELQAAKTEIEALKGS